MKPSPSASGLLPQLLERDARAFRRTAARALSPGRLVLALQSADDFELPDLVPLDDSAEEPPAESGGFSFDAIDLSGDEEGKPAGEERPEPEEGSAVPDDAALVAPPDEPPPVDRGGKPIIARWWFWAAVGVVALGAAGGVAAASGPEIVLPEGSLGTMDRR
ncbi:MAG: hypothetical protein P1V51_12455 [Deltaproteobacteria bacterium]|nr:hypothetical protein [Deltaproteobacteria bacterium]